MTQPIEATLNQRGKVHGDWDLNSEVAMELRKVVSQYIAGDMVPACEEALNAIIGKISRILAGNPHFADHWHDIAGYATLAEKWLNGNYAVNELPEPLSEEAKRELDSYEAVPHVDPNSGIPGIDELKPKIQPRPINKIMDDLYKVAPKGISNPYEPRPQGEPHYTDAARHHDSGRYG